jgi:hypothetical protein
MTFSHLFFCADLKPIIHSNKKKFQGLTQNNSESGDNNKGVKEPKQSSVRSREPPDRDTSAPPMKRPRPAPLPPVIPPSAVQQAANNRHSSSAYKQDHVEEEEDDIQEVMPVKSEPRDPVPSNTAVAAVDTSYRDAAGAGGHTGGQVALEDEYQDDSYDYGDYGEGYEDSSGMIGEKQLAFFLTCCVDRHCC